MNRALRFASSLLVVGVLLAPAQAFAVNKDMIQLQTQIQQLQDAVARLQQSNDERMGVLRDLVQQSSDSVNRMGTAVDTLQKQIAARDGAAGGKIDQVSGQVQSLNDSLDELKTRMARLEKIMKDVQSQQQSMGAQMPAAAPTGTAAPPAGSIPDQPTSQTPGAPAPVVRPLTPLPAAGSDAGSAVPVDDLYKNAIGDYMAAKYALAASEFGDVIKSYPDNTLSGNAWYYLGEMDYRANKFAAAAKDYDHVIEQFPDNNKVPAAHLHKGASLLQLQQKDAGVRELRALIQRFPNSPEAIQARSRLNGMGVPIKPRA